MGSQKVSGPHQVRNTSNQPLRRESKRKAAAHESQDEPETGEEQKHKARQYRAAYNDRKL